MAATLTHSSNGKPHFSSEESLFIDVNEATANATYIEGVVQEEFGENFVIVSSDGLAIKDSSATRGKAMS